LEAEEPPSEAFSAAMAAARPFSTKPAQFVEAWLRDVPGATLEMITAACKATRARGEEVHNPGGYIRTKLTAMVRVGSKPPPGSVPTDWAKAAEEFLVDVEAAGCWLGIYNGGVGLYYAPDSPPEDGLWAGFLRRSSQEALKVELAKFPTAPTAKFPYLRLTLPTAAAGRPGS
jgi:hypothetical protein